MKTIRPKPAQKGPRKSLLDLLLLLLTVVLLFSFTIGGILTPPEIRIDNGKDSIYTGHYPMELASVWAKILEKKTLTKDETERHANTWTWRRFQYDDLAMQFILERNHLSMIGNDRYFTVRYERLPVENTSIDGAYAEDYFLDLWKAFLNGLSHDLGKDEYIVSTVPSEIKPGRWIVTIKQTFNDGTPLENTGLEGWIDRDDLAVTLFVHDWSKTLIDRQAKVSQHEAENVLVQARGISDQTNISSEGYYYHRGRICRVLSYEQSETCIMQIASNPPITQRCIAKSYNYIDIENGKIHGWVVSG